MLLTVDINVITMNHYVTCLSTCSVWLVIWLSITLKYKFPRRFRGQLFSIPQLTIKLASSSRVTTRLGKWSIAIPDPHIACWSLVHQSTKIAISSDSIIWPNANSNITVSMFSHQYNDLMLLRMLTTLIMMSKSSDVDWKLCNYYLIKIIFKN